MINRNVGSLKKLNYMYFTVEDVKFSNRCLKRSEIDKILKKIKKKINNY